MTIISSYILTSNLEEEESFYKVQEPERFNESNTEKYDSIDDFQEFLNEYNANSSVLNDTDEIMEFESNTIATDHSLSSSSSTLLEISESHHHWLPTKNNEMELTTTMTPISTVSSSPSSITTTTTTTTIIEGQSDGIMNDDEVILAITKAKKAMDIAIRAKEAAEKAAQEVAEAIKRAEEIRNVKMKEKTSLLEIHEIKDMNKTSKKIEQKKIGSKKKYHIFLKPKYNTTSQKLRRKK